MRKSLSNLKHRIGAILKAQLAMLFFTVALSACGGGDSANNAIPASSTNKPATTAVIEKSATNTVTKAVLTMPTGSTTVGQMLTFSAANSIGTAGKTLTYKWNFGDGAAAVQGADLTTVQHGYKTAGLYAVSLVITGSKGEISVAAATIRISVAPTPNKPPVAIYVPTLTTLVTGQVTTLDPTGSYDPDGTIVSSSWSDEFRTSTRPELFLQNMTWDTPGTKFVTLTVTDNKGATSAYTLSFIVTDGMTATGKLNDTGIDWCNSSISSPSVCTAVNWATDLWGTMQDAFFGRDAEAKAGTLKKIGGGALGFDFTKIGSNGSPLGIQNGSWDEAGNELAGTKWDCVRDNVTGLLWEVKRNDPSHLRHYQHTYSWYNNQVFVGGYVGIDGNGASSGNGGNSGTVSGGNCIGASCDTQGYVTAINSLPAGQKLCGFSDWRLPDVDELRGVAHMGITNAIDPDYFPNSAQFIAWSSTSYALDTAGMGVKAWSSTGALENPELKSTANNVRLVRSTN